LARSAPERFVSLPSRAAENIDEKAAAPSAISREVMAKSVRAAFSAASICVSLSMISLGRETTASLQAQTPARPCGDRALFSGESPSNQAKFRQELTFQDPAAACRANFAHWHRKISYRFFRLHFEWPVPAEATQLKVVYLGPKLTKS
jgi:hypothetical protein